MVECLQSIIPGSYSSSFALPLKKHLWAQPLQALPFKNLAQYHTINYFLEPKGFYLNWEKTLILCVSFMLLGTYVFLKKKVKASNSMVEDVTL
jgi:hypothetical protein